MPAPVAAEFFAGIGLVRSALERAGVSVAWANDVSPIKERVYAANFGRSSSCSEYVVSDIRTVQGADLPRVDVATASFPCTDVSLAGWRRGLDGGQSGMFWEFVRILGEMEALPPAVLLENVPGLLSSHAGADLALAVGALNDLGYTCDLALLDARAFVPQSRTRLFVAATLGPARGGAGPSTLRPPALMRFVDEHPALGIALAPLVPPLSTWSTLADVVVRLPVSAPEWWSGARLDGFLSSLSDAHRARLAALREHEGLAWRTAYRRTRGGLPVWEIRADEVAGCLRTARGGSSKQALVEAGDGEVRVRWMLPAEYARLQGAGDFVWDAVTDSQALFGFGDAVCVPAVEWVVREMVLPHLAVGVR